MTFQLPADAGVARVGEAPSKEVHRPGLGALRQQGEQTAVLQAAAVEPVQQHERRDGFAAWRQRLWPCMPATNSSARWTRW